MTETGGGYDLETDKLMKKHETGKSWVEQHARDVLNQARENGVPEETIDRAITISGAFFPSPGKREITENIMANKADEDLFQYGSQTYDIAELKNNPELAKLLHEIRKKAHEKVGVKDPSVIEDTIYTVGRIALKAEEKRVK